MRHGHDKIYYLSRRSYFLSIFAFITISLFLSFPPSAIHHVCCYKASFIFVFSSSLAWLLPLDPQQRILPSHFFSVWLLSRFATGKRLVCYRQMCLKWTDQTHFWWKVLMQMFLPIFLHIQGQRQNTTHARGKIFIFFWLVQ